MGVGTATTGDSYTQHEILDTLAITDPRVRSVFLNSAIERRHLVLPPRDAMAAASPKRRATCSPSTGGTPSTWAPGPWTRA